MRTVIGVILTVIFMYLIMQGTVTEKVLEPSTEQVSDSVKIEASPVLNQEYEVVRGPECELHVRLVNDRLELHCTNLGHRITYHVDPTLHNENLVTEDSLGNHLSFYAPRTPQEWHGTITPDTTQIRRLHPGV